MEIRNWGMTQSIKCLSLKHEDLSLNPKTQVKNLSMVTCTYSPQNRDKQILVVCWPASLALPRKPQASERPCLRKQGKWWLGSSAT